MEEWFRAAAEDDCVFLQMNLSENQCSVNDQGETALMVAVQAGNLAAAHILAEAESRMMMPNGWTALMLAASKDNVELCRLLSPLEADVVTSIGLNALMVAAENGSVDSLRLLLDSVGNQMDNEGHTALFYVASGGHMQCANILVQVFPPTKKELIDCMAMATAQGDAEMIAFFNSMIEELVDTDSTADTVMEHRAAVALDRSSSKGIEPAILDSAVYSDQVNEQERSISTNSDVKAAGQPDSMYPYSNYASVQENDETDNPDSKNDLVISDTSLDLRSMQIIDPSQNTTQGNLSVTANTSPKQRNVPQMPPKKADEMAMLRTQLEAARSELETLRKIVGNQSHQDWENKFPREGLSDSTIRRLQDECSNLELKASSLELKNKQLRTTLEDLEQQHREWQREKKLLTETARDIATDFTVENILEFLANNKNDAEVVYNELKQNLSIAETGSVGMPLSVVPLDPAVNSDEDNPDRDELVKSRSSSIEMVEMHSPGTQRNHVPGLEERLESENLALQNEIETLNKQLAMKEEQIKVLRQELYDLRQDQLKMSMTMGPSMESVRPAAAVRCDLSETNHEIEVDMTISNTSFSYPESHGGQKGDSSTSVHATSDGRKHAMSFDIGNDDYDQEVPDSEPQKSHQSTVNLPPLPNTRSNEYPDINASVVQIKLNKIQLELQETLDDKRVILEKLEEERQERSQLVSELNICRSTIDQMTFEISELREKLDESQAKESILSNDLVELRGRLSSPPTQADSYNGGGEMRRDSASPTSILGFSDHYAQHALTVEEVYDLVRNADSYKDLLNKMKFDPLEVDTIVGRQKIVHGAHNKSNASAHAPGGTCLEEGNQEMCKLRQENDELSKHCADLHTSNTDLKTGTEKLISEILVLRKQLEKQERKCADLLREKKELELKLSAPGQSEYRVQDSLYDIQPTGYQNNAGFGSNRNTPPNKSEYQPDPTSVQRIASANNGGNNSYTISADQRPISFSDSISDTRTHPFTTRSSRRSSKNHDSSPMHRSNPFGARERPSVDSNGHLAHRHDDYDRRINIHDLDPYSSITSVSASTVASLGINLVDGTYTNVTPLMTAVLDNNTAEVENCLMYVRKVRSDGATALMIAAYLNNVDIVEKLGPLEANIRGPEKLTALEIALYKEKYEAAEALRQYEGIDTSTGVRVMARRHTDLMTAAIKNNPVKVWSLIPLQAKTQDWSGKTALMHAIEHKSTFCARILARVETKIQDKNGFTALMYAITTGNTDLIDLLVEQEAGFVGRWHECLPSKFTALMLACYYGRLKAAIALVPVEGSMKDSVGRDARYYALNCCARVPMQIKASLTDLFSEYKAK